MTANRRLALFGFVTLALAVLALPAAAQPGSGPGTGPGMMSQGMMSQGMMMGPGMMDRRHMGRMCGPAAAGLVAWRIERIEQIVKPTEAQRAKFDELKAASAKAAEAMRSACPTEPSETVTGQMEAMEKRMETMLQAVKTIRPAMDAFYATLSDEQRARLNRQSRHRHGWHWRDRG